MAVLHFKTRDGRAVEELERHGIHDQLKDMIPQVGDAVCCSSLWREDGGTVYRILSKVFDYESGVIIVYVEPIVIRLSGDNNTVLPS